MFGHDPKGNLEYQKFDTEYGQQVMLLCLRRLFPPGIMGLFILLLFLTMLSRDDSYSFNSAATIIQDIILPFRKAPLTPEQHVRWLKWSAVGVSVFFFITAMLFTNVDYIFMYLTMLGLLWGGGAGAVMLFGLYSKFGNTVGAYASLLVGAVAAFFGLMLQHGWATVFYPFIHGAGWEPAITHFFNAVTSVTQPWVVWKMDPVKFPINSYEIYFICMATSVTAYIVGSLMTYRGPYNLERALHRGKYSTDGVRLVGKQGTRWTWRNAFSKLIGITPEFTTGNKILSWSVFIWTIGYGVGLCFVGVLIWNAFSPWSDQLWSDYFYITTLVVGAIVGIVSTVWLMIGGIKDARRLLKDLKARVDNPLDDGRVQGHVSLMDVSALGSDEDRRSDAAESLASAPPKTPA